MFTQVHTPIIPDMFKPQGNQGAVISGCEQYRYRLWRVWDANKPKVLFIMLNPSTADADNDDPTIRRLIGFSTSWGYGGFEVCNLFAYRTPKPFLIRTVKDPIGPENDMHILTAANDTDRIVCGWGNHGNYMNRDIDVHAKLSTYDYVMYCLGKTRSGLPKHPLYLHADSKLRIMNAARA